MLDLQNILVFVCLWVKIKYKFLVFQQDKRKIKYSNEPKVAKLLLMRKLLRIGWEIKATARQVLKFQSSQKDMNNSVENNRVEHVLGRVKSGQEQLVV